jgi:hypothetical protein
MGKGGRLREATPLLGNEMVVQRPHYDDGLPVLASTQSLQNRYFHEFFATQGHRPQRRNRDALSHSWPLSTIRDSRPLHGTVHRSRWPTDVDLERFRSRVGPDGLSASDMAGGRA